jgi:hypothetical protein
MELESVIGSTKLAAVKVRLAANKEEIQQTFQTVFIKQRNPLNGPGTRALEIDSVLLFQNLSITPLSAMNRYGARTKVPQ